MIQIDYATDHAPEEARTQSELYALPPYAVSKPQGSATVIILERDGSLHHYPPAEPTSGEQQASLELHETQAQPNILSRIIDFTFDVLGINKLEVRVHDQTQQGG
ncbi:MAG: hypothetical protein EI684_01780 [Candidatus Viridilinea halotolerans]|uniref:Uncharacterized protein n=1 Tax=Candidatus Viridilinea halotolerans TaxID=2491704 RepID=A0A426UA26_9CHLR|nr:MAG: hypothetical protein EI684_01780 [Candidatus Viridilinea halotolerans]